MTCTEGVKRKTQRSKKEMIEISPPGRVPQRRGRRRGDEDAEARSRGALVHARVLPPSPSSPMDALALMQASTSRGANGHAEARRVAARRAAARRAAARRAAARLGHTATPERKKRARSMCPCDSGRRPLNCCKKKAPPMCPCNSGLRPQNCCKKSAPPMCPCNSGRLPQNCCKQVLCPCDLGQLEQNCCKQVLFACDLG
jgi:hypothetical protein